MLVWILGILFAHVTNCERGITPHFRGSEEDIENLAQFGDAQHRGPHWYDYSVNSKETDSDEESEKSSTLEFSSYSSSKESSSSVSYLTTKEEKRATRLYRGCNACPHDMLKKYTNIGIKWICGGYQRARRSFKSECMMRYRNCQDGTMFIKIHDHRCRINDSYHGKSFFYNYKV